MCSAVSSTDGGGALIFSYFCSKHRCWGKSAGGGGEESYMVVLTTFYFM